MKTLKITPGKATLFSKGGTLEITGEDGRPIIGWMGFDASDRSRTQNRANAMLFCEAFNVANETGLTPRELLERNNELLEELKTAHRFCNKLMKKLPDSEWKNALVAGVVHMDQTIQKATT